MRSGMARIHVERPHTEERAMRSVSRTGLLAAGFGLAAIGGFVGGLLREQAALSALRGAAGEGSEDLVPWAVGSYRLRWTTFQISQNAAAPASSGSSTPSAAKPR
ncbi:hypothetical protein GCM10010211_53850 [Streptomyces albospinus]|uniref:Uncharacterized protein n=1 Tax=Streptomyces albospinus TaxID=285515 RepID=A0ABQ2VDD3_9ACTN|nr:hypothetical protein GCM10010211_53850 [Streptomyces albospinus]